MAYLDHAATSPLRPEALAAMLPLLSQHYGNPSGTHGLARAAKTALEDARLEVAAALGCGPGEVVFTSGGTEADNLAVLGGAVRHEERPGPGAVVCSAVEHPAVIEPCVRLGARVVAVGPDGTIDLDDLAAALHPGVRLVSVMLANNEVGTIQPLATVATLVRRLAPEAVLHSDAVHGASALELTGPAGLVDMLSLSGHKLGGPKGTGVLMIRRGTPFTPPLVGGQQERGRRPGTPDVAGVVGLAAAMTAAGRARSEEVERIRRLRDELARAVLSSVPGARATGPVDAAGKMPGSFHVVVPGVDAEELLLLLDEAGVWASAGSACASGATEPSPVLLAMGLTPGTARHAVRFTLGYTTTPEDVERAGGAIVKAVEQLRR
jgi:cysteine desulfurase